LRFLLRARPRLLSPSSCVASPPIFLSPFFQDPVLQAYTSVQADQKKDDAADKIASAQRENTAADRAIFEAEKKKDQAAEDLKDAYEQRVEENAVLKAEAARLTKEVAKLKKEKRFYTMTKNLADVEWVEKARSILNDTGSSKNLTIQTLSSPFTSYVSRSFKPKSVEPFQETEIFEDFEAFVESAKEVAKEGLPEKDVVMGLIPGQPRAFIGCSTLLEQVGYYVMQPDDGTAWTSLAHAVIYLDKDTGKYYWLDLESSNGTYLILPHSETGVALGPTGDDRVQLEDGTIVLLGDTILMIRLPGTKKPRIENDMVKYVK